MPPEDAKKRIVNEWQRKADADLAVAERLLSDELVFCNDQPDATLTEARDAVRLARNVRDSVLPLLPELPDSAP